MLLAALRIAALLIGALLHGAQPHPAQLHAAPLAGSAARPVSIASTGLTLRTPFLMTFAGPSVPLMPGLSVAPAEPPAMPPVGLRAALAATPGVSPVGLPVPQPGRLNSLLSCLLSKPCRLECSLLAEASRLECSLLDCLLSHAKAWVVPSRADRCPNRDSWTAPRRAGCCPTPSNWAARCSAVCCRSRSAAQFSLVSCSIRSDCFSNSLWSS